MILAMIDPGFGVAVWLDGCAHACMTVRAEATE